MADITITMPEKQFETMRIAVEWALEILDAETAGWSDSDIAAGNAPISDKVLSLWFRINGV